MSSIRILLVGESWVSTSTHVKGWDFFSSTEYSVGTEYLVAALASDDFEFGHMPSHIAAESFPTTIDGLARYDVILLSDIGANTFLLHPDTSRGLIMPNRLKLLKTWVENGGGLGMCGGYMSFAGINAAAKYYRSPIEAILPVNIHTFDDRVEAPEGVIGQIVDAKHPILDGITGEWPPLLGYNELILKSEAQLLVKANNDPLLAVQSVGSGRTLSWASDIGPHWCPPPFLAWSGYARLWQQSIRWLAQRI
ncbi:MAG: glutamine amidotransferase [Chloroflexota bacterium]